MKDEPTPTTPPASTSRNEAPGQATRRPDAAGPAAHEEDGPLESLGKAVGETVLGADRTTTGDRVRDKLSQNGGSARRR